MPAEPLTPVADQARPAHVLRVMSYNVHDLRDDRAAAARVVRAVAPDVLCLQEVPRRLTTELRLPPFAQACHLVWHRGRMGTGGTTVLTAPRVVVHELARGRLRVRFPDRTRGYAAAIVSLPGSHLNDSLSGSPLGSRPGHGPVAVTSVHLGLRAPERQRHAAAVIDVLRRFGDRAVVAGDLNEGPGGTAYDLLAARYPRASGGEPTFPAHHPTVELDGIFAGRDLRVRATAPTHLDERDVAAGSDHRPLWVDLDLAGVPS